MAETAPGRTTQVKRFERRRPSRKPFPEHLARERVVVPAPTACTCCGSQRLSKVSPHAVSPNPPDIRASDPLVPWYSPDGYSPCSRAAVNSQSDPALKVDITAFLRLRHASCGVRTVLREWSPVLSYP